MEIWKDILKRENDVESLRFKKEQRAKIVGKLGKKPCLWKIKTVLTMIITGLFVELKKANYRDNSKSGKNNCS